jgi:hypothetical protein
MKLLIAEGKPTRPCMAFGCVTARKFATLRGVIWTGGGAVGTYLGWRRSSPISPNNFQPGPARQKLVYLQLADHSPPLMNTYLENHFT